MLWSSNSASTAKSSANMIYSYFIDIVSAINSESVSHQLNPSSSLPAHITSLSFTSVQESDVSKALASMASTNSSGTDSITLYELRMSSPEVIPALSYIFNLSINTKTFPSQWMHARVTPIYKKGDVHNVVNYRSMSILTTLSKLFEKIIDEQVCSHLNNEKLISTNQHGFIKGRSCKTALATLSANLFSSRDGGHYSAIAVLDISKAFNTAQHKMLITKLAQLDIAEATCD